MFDELRGLAIVLVLTYHVGGVTGWPNLMHGELGVDIFVLLSGTVLALTHRPSEGTWAFLGRRLVTLLPAYWIALTLFWQTGIHLLGRVHTPTNVWSHYLCLHPWWGDRYLLGFSDSFWFLGLIVPLYFVYAGLRRFFDRMDILVGAGLIVSFGLTYFTAKIANQPSLFVHLGLRPPIFFLGIVFGRMLRDGIVTLPLTAWLGLGVFLTWYGTFVTGLLVGYNIAGFAVFFAYFALRANRNAAGARPLCRLMAWLGVYSYEIFLLHQPLIRDYNLFVWTRLKDGTPPTPVETAIGVAVGLLVTLVLAVGLHPLAGLIGRLVLPRRQR